jgi:hypothetical protein
VDLKKVVKRIAVTFVMFLLGTYSISFADAFNTTIVKGAAMAIIIYPPIYWHYSDESKY